MQKWYAKNKEKQNKTVLEDYHKNKDKWNIRRKTLRKKKEILKYLKFVGLDECAFCGGKEDLHIHHFEYGGTDINDLMKSVIPLCKKCHPKVHRMYCRIERVKGLDWESLIKGWRELKLIE